MKIDAQALKNTIAEISSSKSMSEETIVQILQEAIVKGYTKELGGHTQDMPDLDVRAIIDLEQGNIDIIVVRKVLEDDDITDDLLEISVEEAQKFDKKLKAGDDYIVHVDDMTVKKTTLNSIRAVMKQKFAEVEKQNLYESFKDKINTMVTGRVEKSDERGTSVSIGRTTVYLPKSQMIGDETYEAGDSIRLYISGVKNDTKGAKIEVSRSSDGFLRCLFFEEVREVYDGTIEIVNIAREAGERSKVAVKANNPDVDPAGSCIGPNGSRIQKIVSQLGNGSNNERIDVIAYSNNRAFFIMEALKPAKAIGINYDEENNTCTVVVKDDSLSLAIGRRGVNARLAVKLTNCNIDIKTESEALEEEIEFTPYEELEAKEIEEKTRLAAEKRAQVYFGTNSGDVLPGLPSGYVAPQNRTYIEEAHSDIVESLEEQSEMEEISTPAVEAPTETVAEPVAEPVAKEEKVEIKHVKTTTTISDLEKALESSSKQKNTQKSSSKKTTSKKEEETEESVKTKVDTSNYMSIYTEEELKEFEAEDAEEEDSYEDDDIDYDEYDEYYDDDDK